MTRSTFAQQVLKALILTAPILGGHSEAVFADPPPGRDLPPQVLTDGAGGWWNPPCAANCGGVDTFDRDGRLVGAPQRPDWWPYGPPSSIFSRLYDGTNGLSDGIYYNEERMANGLYSHTWYSIGTLGSSASGYRECWTQYEPNFGTGVIGQSCGIAP